MTVHCVGGYVVVRPRIRPHHSNDYVDEYRERHGLVHLRNVKVNAGHNGWMAAASRPWVGYFL